MANEQLALRYGYNNPNQKPSALLNSIFMSTVNRAAKTLISVASNATSEGAGEKWRAADHLRFMFMVTTWLAVWALRILMDHLPFSAVNYSLVDDDRRQFSPLGSLDLMPSLSSTLSSSLAMFSSSSSTSSSLELALSGSFESGSSMALERALTNILVMMNEIPASSRKYQFAVSMADRILDENIRPGHLDLLKINRAALASAFGRTQTLLYSSLQSSQQKTEDSGEGWMSRAVKSLPFGSYISFLMNVGVGAFFPTITTTTTRNRGSNKQMNPLAITWQEEDDDVIIAEKHAQELLWLTNKMRMCGGEGGMDDAVEKWSTASGLASIALTANPRVQGFIVKITAILLGELRHANMETPRQVKFRFLAIWLPLFCFAENGLSYPLMSGYEKKEMERITDEVISSLPYIDQEVILSNWLQDYSISSSDWPNLQATYDKWCQSTRRLIM